MILLTYLGGAIVGYGVVSTLDACLDFLDGNRDLREFIHGGLSFVAGVLILVFCFRFRS